MLVSSNINTKYRNVEGYSQETNEFTRHKKDFFTINGALREGWQILESANYLARGRNNEGSGYLITLYHPARNQVRQTSVLASQEMDNLLTKKFVQA